MIETTPPHDTPLGKKSMVQPTARSAQRLGQERVEADVRGQFDVRAARPRPHAHACRRIEGRRHGRASRMAALRSRFRIAAMSRA